MTRVQPAKLRNRDPYSYRKDCLIRLPPRSNSHFDDLLLQNYRLEVINLANAEVCTRWHTYDTPLTELHGGLTYLF